MLKTIKVVIPMAGLGTRLRPQTWSRPKQILRVADKMVIEHVLDMMGTLPANTEVEYIFIIGYLGDKVRQFMEQYYPDFRVSYVVQEEMRGQSDAIYLAREYLQGPMLMVFADTLIQTDMGFLADESADIVGWVKPVPDPRRFGVAKLDDEGWVTRLVEKPMDLKNNLAVVGCYYFQEANELIRAIEEQFARDIRLKGEYFIADAINIMLERGKRMRTEQVEVWLDAGTPEAMLETNRYLLEHGHANDDLITLSGKSALIPPVYVHPSAKVEGSIVGPHVAIGAGCTVKGSIIKNSILEENCVVEHANLADSLIGQYAQVERINGRLNIGDHAKVSG